MPVSIGSVGVSLSNPDPSLFLPLNYTVSTLPDPTAYPKMYAWVTDLHDNQPDRVISDGVSWKPVRPFAAFVTSNADSSMTLTPLLNSPTQVMRGTLTAARTITMANTYVYAGAKFRIKRETTGVLAMLVKDAASSLLGTLSSATWADFEYIAGQGWIQTASGGLV